ncbi:hypothetical protein ALC57_06002 [Trachymyrmex cornetzi]|uniref:Uncharacterized protein n=1 Tax=Trachymyrmex cornetzi TaxID=471704 RepID=A0A151J9A8_9HYME|nr:hypothetical protein ALC57_06002 [Trachymyrmex cornetzi]
MAFFMAITDTRLKDSPEGSLPEYEALGNPWTIPLVGLWKSMLTSELRLKVLQRMPRIHSWQEDSGMRFAEPSCDPTLAICSHKNSLPRTASSMQSSRFGFFRAGYVATGIYAASTAKRVASQKSPCKNEERSKEEDGEENGERYRLKTVKSGSTLSPVQSAKRLSLFSFALFVF